MEPARRCPRSHRRVEQNGRRGFNPEVPNVLYLAMSSISNAMTDAQGDIDLAENSCGIVYRMTMNTTWNVNRIDPAIVGGRTSSAEYQCNIDNLAGPDNLLVLDDGRVLVGEDTWRHEHNTVAGWQAASSDVVGSEVLTSNVTDLSDETADGALVHHAEMSNLRPGRTYTVNLLVSDAATGRPRARSTGATSPQKANLARRLLARIRLLPRGHHAVETSGCRPPCEPCCPSRSRALPLAQRMRGRGVMPRDSDGFLPGFGFPLTIIAALGALAVLNESPADARAVQMMPMRHT